MDLIMPQIQGVYNLYDSIKNCNNVPCPHIVQRVKATEKLMLFIALKNPDQLSDAVNKALERLGEVLSSAAELITKFSEAYRVTKFMRSSHFTSEFDKLNVDLSVAFEALSGALHVRQGKVLDEQETKLVTQESMLAEQKNKLDEQEKRQNTAKRK